MKACRIKVETFNHMIAGVKDAADKADIREPLNYILMEVYNDIHKIKAVACDGYIMATEWADTVVHPDHDENFVFYVKPNMPKMPKHAGDVYVTLKESDGKTVACVECANQRIEIAQPEKTYIQYKKIIADAKPTTRVCFNIKYLLTVLKGIQAGSGEKQVVLEFPDDGLRPVLARPYENPESVRLIMPIRLSHSDN